MKKYFLFIFSFFLLTSCRSINIHEIRQVNETTGNKLPTLEAVYIDATSSIPQYWEVGSKVVQNGDTYATIFYEELEKNLTNPYEDINGYIELRNETILSTNTLWSVLSGLTFTVPNLLGMPFTSGTVYSNVYVRLLDKKGRLIKRYQASAEDTEYVAMWWGYMGTADEIFAFKVRTYRKALTKVLEEIKSDYTFLLEKLK